MVKKKKNMALFIYYDELNLNKKSIDMIHTNAFL
jgi:hypothetical protein